jgi:hypothetical protein
VTSAARRQDGEFDGARDGDARRSITQSARQCIERAATAGIPADASARDLYVSDEVFRQLHQCVDTFARGLRSLGEPPERGEALLALALRDATDSIEPHPALAEAIVVWFREAYAGG